MTFIGFLGFFITGIVGSAFAPAFPFLIDDFGLTLAVAGLVFPIRSIGGFAGTLLGGIWSDSAGRKRLIVIGTLVQATGFALVPLTQNWSMALPAFLLMGIGGGFQGSGLNALVAEVNPHRRGLALNVLHGIYGIGSFIGPLLAATLLKSEGAWRMIFLGSAIFWVLFGFICLFPTFPAPGGKQKGRVTGAWPLLVSPVFLLLLTIPFLYNSTATGLVGWITTYVQNEVHLPVMLGASMVSLFYVGLTIGRFACAALSDKVGYGRMLMALAIGVAASYPMVAFSRDPWVLGAGVFFSGLFFSGLYPTAMAWATRLYPGATGTITGILSTGMSLGVMTVPPLMGWIGDRMGLGFSMSLNYIGALVLVVVAFSLLRLQGSGSGTSDAPAAAQREGA